MATLKGYVCISPPTSLLKFAKFADRTPGISPGGKVTVLFLCPTESSNIVL